VNISPERFEKLVLEAERDVLAQLPSDLQEDARQVVLEIEDQPAPEILADLGDGMYSLFGLYQGVPLIRRRPDTVLLQPDRITLYRRPIASHARTEIELKAQIRKTIIHELGHYFGFSEAELEARGWG
jgi:predicted Zn-dependent protease with MMP-like domain